MAKNWAKNDISLCDFFSGIENDQCNFFSGIENDQCNFFSGIENDQCNFFSGIENNQYSSRQTHVSGLNSDNFNIHLIQIVHMVRGGIGCRPSVEIGQPHHDITDLYILFQQGAM